MRVVHTVLSLVLAAAVGGCVAPAGQKVRVLLVDQELTCQTEEGSEIATATMQLELEDDLFLAQVQDLDSGDWLVLPAIRTGTTVVFECLDGLTRFTARRATVLQARAGTASAGDDGGADDGDDGSAPTF